MKTRHSSVFRSNLPLVIRFSVTLGVTVSTALAVDYYKADNVISLTNVSSWWLDAAGTLPVATPPGAPVNTTSPSAVCIWNSLVTGPNTVAMADVGIQTLRILNPGGAVTLESVGTVRTMTVGNGGGIDMADATQDLTLNNLFYRAASSNANVAIKVKTGRTLTFGSTGQLNVRNDSGGVTYNLNNDGLSAGTIKFGANFAPSHVVVGGGVVEFNRLTGNTRLGTNTTTVNGGKLVVNNTSGSATGSGSVTINNNGTLTTQNASSGLMTGAVTIASGGAMVPREDAIGSLTAGSLTLAAGSKVKWEGVDPLNADIINVTASGGLTINGSTLELFNVGTTTPFTGLGTYQLFSYSGTIGGSGLSGLSVAESSKIPGQLYQFGSDGASITLNISIDTRPRASWNVDAGGNWSATGNWTGGVSPNAPTFIASLGGAEGVPITAPRTINVDVESTVGTLAIDSAQPFTVAGPNKLLFDEGVAAATLQVKNGSHEISAPLGLSGVGLISPIENAASTLTLSGEITGAGGIAKSGPGTLILTADNGYFGDTSNGTGGVLQLGAGGTTGAVSGLISNSGTLRINRSDTLDLAFTVSGTGNVDFAGVGTTRLTVPNTYSGPTTISAGSIEIGDNLALQNTTLTYSTTGGTLAVADTLTSVTLGALTGDRPFPLTNLLGDPISLNVGKNNASTSYSASTTGTGTDFTKSGSGTFAISGTHAFTGNATIAGGVLSLDTNAGFSAAAINTTTAGSKLLVNGGTVTSSALSTFANASAGLEVVSGTANFNGGITSENNISSGNFFARSSGGILNTASLSISRGSLNIGTEPTTGQTTNGLYINGGAVNIAGSVVLGNNANSSVSARMDNGSLDVGGALTVGIDNLDRWSVLDIGGGTFSSSDTVTGVRIGTAFNGRAIMLVRGGVATAERFQFGQGAFSGSSILSLTGGSLYVGAGGMILGSTNPAITARLRLGGGVLGAKADSASTVPVTLTGAAVVTGADSLDVPRTVSFSGRVDGTGSLTKNGSGTVSFTSPANSFSGTVTVNSGTLGLGGQSGAINVASPAALTPYGTLGALAASTVNGTLAIRYDVPNGNLPGRLHSQGVLTLGPTSTLDLSGVGTLTAPFYVLASGTSGISGTFGTVPAVLPAGYTLSYTHNNGSGFPVVALVGSPTAFDTWVASYGLSGAPAAAGADPDGDGVSNLIEFGLGGRSPVLADGRGPLLGRDGDFLTLTFDHIAGGDLTFRIEANDGLDDAWTVVQTYPAFGTAGTTVYTDNVAVGSTPARFIRLSVVSSN